MVTSIFPNNIHRPIGRSIISHNELKRKIRALAKHTVHGRA